MSMIERTIMTSTTKNNLIEQYVALIEKIHTRQETKSERDHLDLLEKLIFGDE